MEDLEFPQEVKNAMGILMLYALSRGISIDSPNSVVLSIDNVHTNQMIEYGDWKFTVERTRKPK